MSFLDIGKGKMIWSKTLEKYRGFLFFLPVKEKSHAFLCLRVLPEILVRLWGLPDSGEAEED